MPDLARAYRLWLWRRLAWLAPAVAAAFAAVVWLAGHADVPPWARLPAIAVSVLLGAAPAYLVFHVAVCSRLQAHGRRREAQSLRAGLRAYRLVSAASVGGLGVLAALSGMFTETFQTRGPSPREPNWAEGRGGDVAHRSPPLSFPPAPDPCAAPP